MFKNVMRGALTALVAGIFSSMLATASSALVLNLTDCHMTSGCGAAGTIYGTVTLTQDATVSTTTDVTVHLNSPYTWASTGAGDFMYVKFNASGVAVGDITNISGAAGLGTLGAFSSPPTSLNGDGTGTFQFAIGCTTGASCPNGLTTISSDITFQVLNATVADLSNTFNSKGINWVVDIGSAAGTGPVGAPGPLAGAGIPGLIAGCGALIALARRRRQKMA